MLTSTNANRFLAVLAMSVALTASVPSQADTAAEVKRVEVGKNVVLEVQGTQRRVEVRASACLREGQLEGLLTRKGTKEHEYILAAEGKRDGSICHPILQRSSGRRGDGCQILVALPTRSPL
jgi:hypothetical protein